jgi:hypothetical protein
MVMVNHGDEGPLIPTTTTVVVVMIAGLLAHSL